MGGLEDMAEESSAPDESEAGSFQELLDATREVRDSVENQNLNVGIYGKAKTGKTHFAFSAPDPIFFLDTESGTGPVEPKFSDKQIKVLSLNETGEDYAEDSVQAWRRFKQAANYSVENEDEIETVVVDSLTDLWEHCQNYCKQEIFGLSPEEKMNNQWDWGDINARWKNVIQKLLKGDFNVIFTARAQQQYNGAGNPIDEYDPKWQNKTDHWVNIVIHNTKEASEDGTKTLYSEIEDSRFDLGGEETIMGTEIENMEWDDLVEVIRKTQTEAGS